MRFKFHYCVVIGAGFKEEVIDDKVFFKQYGYPYKIVRLFIGSYAHLDWNQETQYIKLVVLSDDDQGDVLAEVSINTEIEFRNIITRLRKRSESEKG